MVELAAGRGLEALSPTDHVSIAGVAKALARGCHVATFREPFDRSPRPGARRLTFPELGSLWPSPEKRSIRPGGSWSWPIPTSTAHLVTSGLSRGEGIEGLEPDHHRLKPARKDEGADLARQKGLLENGGSVCHGEERGPLARGAIRVSVGVLDEIDRVPRTRAEVRSAEEAGVKGEGKR